MIGKHIRTERKKLGMRQWQLGAKIGVSTQQISKYELEKDSFKIDRLIQIAKALGQSPKEFIGIAIDDDQQNEIEHLLDVCKAYTGRLKEKDGRIQFLEGLCGSRLEGRTYWMEKYMAVKKPWYRRWI